jgi:hypothetical protein
LENVPANRVGCFSKAATLIHSEIWSPVSAKSGKPPSFAPRRYYPLILQLINNTSTLCVFFPLKPFFIFWTFAATECKLAVESPEQKKSIRKRIPDVKLIVIMDPGWHFGTRKNPGCSFGTKAPLMLPL